MGSWVAVTLLGAIALGILWMCFAVFAPVVGIAIAPGLLRARLIVLIVRISLPLEVLPFSASLALASARRTVSLLWVLGTWLKRLTARCTMLAFHEILHTQ